MRGRLIASFALIIIVTLAAVGYFVQRGAIQEVTTFVRRGGLVGVEALVGTLENHYQDVGSWQGAEAILVSFTANQDGPHGQGEPHGIGMGMGQGMTEDMVMRSTIVLSDNQGKPLAANTGFDTQQIYTAAELENGIPLTSNGEVVGYLMSESFMGMSSASYEAELGQRLSQAAVNAALIAGGIAVILASALAYYSFQPVRQLSRAAGMLARGQMGRRVEVRGSGELAELGANFNAMAAALEEADQKRKALTADIAHELRNPLAVQRANLEALEDGLYPLTSENLVPVLEQNRLLTRLVDDLHTLALSDAHQLALKRQPTDVLALVTSVISAHQTQAQLRHVELGLEGDLNTCPSVSVDPDRIGQVVGNLVQNALRHTSDGGRVLVRAACEGNSLCLEVLDSGPGIAEADLERIFERFYRGDTARSREQGGSGLGLTIARRLAQAHGGSLTAANRAEGGAVFTLRVPLDEVGTG